MMTKYIDGQIYPNFSLGRSRQRRSGRPASWMGASLKQPYLVIYTKIKILEPVNNLIHNR